MTYSRAVTRQRRTKPQFRITPAGNFVKFGRVVLERERQTDRQTHTQTRSSQYLLYESGSVLRWETAHEYTVTVTSYSGQLGLLPQTPRPPTLSEMENGYRPKWDGALRLVSKDMYICLIPFAD